MKIPIDDPRPDDSAIGEEPLGSGEGAAPDASGDEPAKEETAGTVAALEAELAQERDRHLRALADFDNYRKRVRRDLADAQATARFDLIQRLLPTLDNLERALAAHGTRVSSLRQGIQMVHDQLREVLASQGLAAVEAVGSPFDPNVHEGVFAMPSDAVPPGYVVQEIERGYLLADRVLRPAKVVVSAQPDGGGAGAS